MMAIRSDGNEGCQDTPTTTTSTTITTTTPFITIEEALGSVGEFVKSQTCVAKVASRISLGLSKTEVGLELVSAVVAL